ncbi:ANK [Seminavis robusta]|uniref:ANK n=1 Tax=Seminavis robusta TaxID=568900 RepID=A0A9N8DL43_9STRA|nr:ANK [Seminavis robusta]|eukprot:Sro144_g066980.1 ANK (353) ;mRNA; f:46752-47810
MNNPLMLSHLLEAEDDMKPMTMDASDEFLVARGKNDEDTEETDSEEDSDEEASSSEEGDSDDDSDDSDDDDGEDTSSWGSEMDDLEAALTLGQRQKDMKRSLSSPAMAAVFSGGPPLTKSATIEGLKDLAARMKKSESNAYLQKVVAESAPVTLNDPYADTKPDDFLQTLLEGISASSFPSETWHDYFQSMEPEHVEAYTTEMVMAIRNDDYEVLRERLKAGCTLQCCNHHGESILHLVCRRGSTDMLRFLMEEGEVSVRIRDDKGRTPLHDACWTENPQFSLVYALLESSPELLFVQDHRGHTPLSYAPRKVWGHWNGFLQKHRIFLRASVRSLRFDRAKYLARTIVPCLK